MSQQRTARLNELLRRELSQLIRHELKDPRVHTATVTDVVTAPDLTHATVYIRTLEEQVPAEEAVKGLASASGYMRRRLGKQLRLRRVPEFHFEVDHTLERASRIEQLLEEVRQDGADEPGSV